MLCPTVLKCDILVHNGTRSFRIVTVHFRSDGGQPTNYQFEIAIADCSISLKFGTEFYHVTADTLQKSV